MGAPTDAGARSGQVGARQHAAGTIGVALERELDDALADCAEVIATGTAQHREQADRREARDGVDLVEVELARIAVDQKVNAREALATDRQECLAGYRMDALAQRRVRCRRNRSCATRPRRTWPRSRRTRDRGRSRPGRTPRARPRCCRARSSRARADDPGTPQRPRDHRIRAPGRLHRRRIRHRPGGGRSRCRPTSQAGPA